MNVVSFISESFILVFSLVKINSIIPVDIGLNISQLLFYHSASNFFFHSSLKLFAFYPIFL